MTGLYSCTNMSALMYGHKAHKMIGSFQRKSFRDFLRATSSGVSDTKKDNQYQSKHNFSTGQNSLSCLCK
jgi:hypothetical protein